MSCSTLAATSTRDYRRRSTPASSSRGRRRRYTPVEIANQISCPTLVCDAEHDHFFHDARTVFRALSCPKEYVLFTSAEGAEEHCQVGAMSLFHQRIFDWLDEVTGWQTT